MSIINTTARAIDTTSNSREAIAEVIEVLRKNFDYDNKQAYVKRELIRRLYDIALGALQDSQAVVTSHRFDVGAVKTTAAMLFDGADTVEEVKDDTIN